MPVARAKGELPASISCSTAPRAKTSERASLGSPRTCSGDMYPTVPITEPGSVCTVIVSLAAAVRGIRILAKPKSRILMRPSAVSNTLSGFRSRCVIPAA